MSQRMKRVEVLMKRELGVLLAKDYFFQGAIVTVNGINVSPDLRNARVYVGVISGSESGMSAQQVVSKLNDDHGAIQKKMSKRVILKFTPKLFFIADNSVERGSRVVEVLDSLNIPKASEMNEVEDIEEYESE